MPSYLGPVSITNPGTLTNYDGDVVSYPVSASDSAGNALSYSAANLPPGENIDPAPASSPAPLAAPTTRAALTPRRP